MMDSGIYSRAMRRKLLCNFLATYGMLLHSVVASEYTRSRRRRIRSIAECNSEVYKEIISKILAGKPSTKEDIHRIKLAVCKKYSLDDVPSDADILSHIEKNSVLEEMLKLKSVRTSSGIAPVAVMSSPEQCPHGKCIFCPGGVESGTAQSYTGREPAALRAGIHNYMPYEQVMARLEQLRAIGHKTDKIELIVMGGTFTARTCEYQEYFIKRCLDAINQEEAENLEEAQEINMRSNSRCIGLTIETRPDWCREVHVERILRFGATRVELGVQTVYNNILRSVRRGHTVLDTIKATSICKDAGLKVCYHMMPGLPGTTKRKDLSGFKRIFSDDNFKPDMLKIYPTLVIKGTELYEKWERGEYYPLGTEEAVQLIAEMKKFIPRWVRIQRIQRDIPAGLIDAGVKKSNLRQLVAEKMKEKGIKCKCIRCREVAHRSLQGIECEIDRIKLLREDYDASKGKEIFLSFEDVKNDVLIGYARLRKVAHPYKCILENSLVVRELKVLGPVVQIGSSAKIKEWQHRGYGKELLRECEKIASEENAKFIFVMSGIGARNYYKKFGYERMDVYMGKRLS